MAENRNLPTIIELYDDVTVASEMNQLNILLNQLPRPEWVKEHPHISGYKYIPIERIEFLLTRLFLQWRVEVKDVKLIANSVQVTVRLHYLQPISLDWTWQDGVGASPLQMNKGAGAIDFNTMKSGAVQMAAPAAETYAIKDAAEKIGRIFGKDINRKDFINYDGLQTAFVKDKASYKREVENALQHCQDDELRGEIVNSILDAESLKTDTAEFYQNLISNLTGK